MQQKKTNGLIKLEVQYQLCPPCAVICFYYLLEILLLCSLTNSNISSLTKCMYNKTKKEGDNAHRFMFHTYLQVCVSFSTALFPVFVQYTLMYAGCWAHQHVCMCFQHTHAHTHKHYILPLVCAVVVESFQLLDVNFKIWNQLKVFTRADKRDFGVTESFYILHWVIIWILLIIILCEITLNVINATWLDTFFVYNFTFK